MSIPDFYHNICKTKINTLLVFHFQAILILWQTVFAYKNEDHYVQKYHTGLPTAIRRQVSLYSVFQVTSIATISNQPLLIIY